MSRRPTDLAGASAGIAEPPLPSPKASYTERRRRGGGAAKSEEAICLLLLLALVGVLTASFWPHANRLPETLDPDAHQQLAFAYVTVDAAHQYGEIPLWNPYVGGGVPWAGYIYNPGISPISIIYILFGEVVGIKVFIVFILLLGIYGMYGTGRTWLSLRPPAALLGAALYGASLWMPGRLMSGNYDEPALFLLPFLLFCFYRLLQRRWIGLLLPLCYMTALAQAKYAAFIMAAALVVFGLLYSDRVGATRKEILALWGLSLGAGVLLALPKLLPLLALLDADLVNQQLYQATHQYEGFRELFGYVTGALSATYHYYIGIGLFAMLTAALGGLVDFKRARGLVVVLVVGVLFALGTSSPIPLWRLPASLPVFSTMNSFGKYWNVWVLFALSGLAAVTWEWLAAQAASRLAASYRTAARWAVVGIGLADVAFLLITSQALYAGLFTGVPVPATPEPFHHVADVELLGKVDRYRLPPQGIDALNPYLNIKRNVGTLTWYGNLVLPEHAQPRVLITRRNEPLPNPGYVAEAYCATPGGPERAVHDVRFTYNTISARAPMPACRQVVFNVNYHEGWQSASGEVVDHEGLLAVNLSPDASGDVHLRFRDGRFTLGLVVAGLVALLCVVGYRRYRTMGGMDAPREQSAPRHSDRPTGL